MYFFFIILITVIAFLITVSVLMQAGRGGGLSGIGGGGQATQLLGARQAPDFLEKTTWSLGTAFIVLCVLANFFVDSGTQRSVIQDSDFQIESELPGAPVQDALPMPVPTEMPAEPGTEE